MLILPQCTLVFSCAYTCTYTYAYFRGVNQALNILVDA